MTATEPSAQQTAERAAKREGRLSVRAVDVFCGIERLVRSEVCSTNYRDDHEDRWRQLGSAETVG